MKKFAVMALAAVMLLSAVTGCGTSAEGEASVQSVSMICGLGSTGLTDRFAGMVTAQSETQIKKNDNATVDAIKVKVDQEVKKGDALFTYDSSQARLDLEMAQLELEQMKNELEMKKEEKEQLERDKEQLGEFWEELPLSFVSSSNSGLGKEEILGYIGSVLEDLKNKDEAEQTK